MRGFANCSAQAYSMQLAGRTGMAMLFAGVLAFLAPFGTYRFEPMVRIGYWTVQMTAWLLLSQFAAWLIWQSLGMRFQGTVQRRIVATAIASLPMIIVTGTANSMMDGWSPHPSKVVELLLAILLIGGGYTYLSDRLVQSLMEARHPPLPKVPPLGVDADPVEGKNIRGQARPSDVALLQRLPTHMRAEIICLQVEDHYVRVHSGDASVMVLMRFSDALRSLDHLPGSQVHRSWWVAADAVMALRRTGRTAQLTLVNGLSVPVSQPYLALALKTWSAIEVG